MYKLTDYVVQVDITGLDPIPNRLYHTAGSVLVTYNNGPQSRFALKPSLASKELLKKALLQVARGQVLDAIETVQRFKDGEPAWLLDAKHAAVKNQEAKDARARMLAWQAANPIR